MTHLAQIDPAAFAPYQGSQPEKPKPRPTPEPAVYGAVLMVVCLFVLLWKRARHL